MNWLLQRGLNLQQRIDFYRGLSMLLRSKVTLSETLEEMQNSYRIANQRKLGRTAKKMAQRLAQGETFSTGLLKGIAPNSEQIIIASAAEQSDISKGLEIVIKIAKRVDDGKRELLQAMAMPVFLLIVLIIAFWGSGQIAFPFLETLKERSAWGYLPNAVYDASVAMEQWLPLLILGFLVFVWMTSLSLAHWTGRLRNAADWTFPPYSIYRRKEAAIFAASLQALFSSGSEAISGLAQMQRVAKPWLAAHINVILGRLNKGKPFGEAFSVTVFSQRTRGLLIILGARAGQKEIAGIFEITAEDEIAELTPAIKRVARIIQLMLFVAVATLVLIYIQAFLQITQQLVAQ